MLDGGVGCLDQVGRRLYNRLARGCYLQLGPGANTDTKLLIYGLFQKGRVLAQDAVTFICD